VAIGDDIQGLDRTMLNVVIVLGSLALGLGVIFVITGWALVKSALFIAIPLAVVALFALWIRTFWPRGEE
jgi:hypothetical protein